MITKNFENSIQLTNEGSLSVFFVGTGNAFCKKNFQTNLVIVKGQDHLVVDFGTLFAYAWEVQFNTKLTDIENVLLTHPHADHIGGVEELAFVGRYIKNKKINLIINNEFKKKLWNESLRGGLQYSEDGKMTFDDYFIQQNPKLICKKPYPIYETNVGSINIKMIQTFHVTTKANSFKNALYSVGLIIDDRILFTGDTQFNPDQLNWILENYNIEYIFEDCDVLGHSVGVHASLEQLKSLPENVKSKMLLCHYNKDSQNVDVTKDGFLGFVKPGVYYCLKGEIE